MTIKKGITITSCLLIILLTGCVGISQQTTQLNQTLPAEVTAKKTSIKVSKAFTDTYKGENKKQIFETGDNFLSYICGQEFDNEDLKNFTSSITDTQKFILGIDQTSYLKDDISLSFDLQELSDEGCVITATTRDESVRWQLLINDSGITDIIRITPEELISNCQLSDIYASEDTQIYLHENVVSITTDYLHNETYLYASLKAMRVADDYTEIARNVLPEGVILYPASNATVIGVSKDCRTLYKVYTSSSLGPQVEEYHSVVSFDTEMSVIAEEIIHQLINKSNVQSKINNVSISISDEKAKLFNNIYSTNDVVPIKASGLGCPTGEYSYKFTVDNIVYSLIINFEFSETGIKEAHCWINEY